MNATPPFKMVALDVDGTLVDGSNTMSRDAYDAVHAAAAAGAEIVIATGRSMPGVFDVLRKLELTQGVAVSSNGAVVFGFDGVDWELLHVVTFDAREVVRRIIERIPDAIVAVEEIGVGYRVNQDFPDGEINGKMTVQTIDELVNEPVTRVIIRSPEHSTEEFNSIVRDIGLTGTNYFIGYSAWLDLAPLDVSKASGLSYLTRMRGLGPEDVLAIGDGHNDHEMLKWAGRGVAMGHAPDSVKAVSDAVTGSIGDDGAVVELNRWFSPND